MSSYPAWDRVLEAGAAVNRDDGADEERGAQLLQAFLDAVGEFTISGEQPPVDVRATLAELVLPSPPDPEALPN